MERRVAVVTGGNRGLGLATCQELAKRGHQVILCARNKEDGVRQANLLKQKDLPVDFRHLDIDEEKSIEAFAKILIQDFGRVDILVNNAGVLLDERSSSAMHAKSQDILATFRTNTLGAFLLTRALLPTMLRQNYGRIVNVSSGMGQLSEMNGGYAAYRISKTALNAVTKIFSEEAKPAGNVLVNSVCPGWVKTDMGGAQAERSLEQGIFGIVWAATLPEDGPSGGFFRDGKAISW